MTSRKRLGVICIATLPLLLAACGDGWETRPYTGVPYGDRTAGTGIEYVRAGMMPQRGPNVETIMEETKAVTPPPVEEPKVEVPEPAAPAEPITPADKLMENIIKK